MKIYEIYDEEIELSIGTLLFYEKSKSFVIELQDYLDEWNAPLLLTSFVKRGIYSIPKDISLLWVKERIIPSGRQNINAILDCHKLREYDEFRFLELSSGKCSQDSMIIRCVEQLPDYVTKRQQKNLEDVVMLHENRVLMFFRDGSVKITDMKIFADDEEMKKVLKNRKLLQSGKVGVGGYSISFDDAIDFPSWRLYERGITIPLSLEDFKSFILKNVMMTTECCELLECTRQNAAYLVKQGYLNPVKSQEKGNLYLKGDILKNTW